MLESGREPDLEGETLRVEVQLELGEETWLALCETESVAVEVAPWDADCDELPVTVPLGVGVPETEGRATGLPLPLRVVVPLRDREGDVACVDVRVMLREFVRVGDSESVVACDAEPLWEALPVPVREFDCEGVHVRVMVWVRVTERVCVIVPEVLGVRVGVGVLELLGESVCVELLDPLGVLVEDAVRDWVCVPLSDWLPLLLPLGVAV